jgi:hypothetical protein
MGLVGGWEGVFCAFGRKKKVSMCSPVIFCFEKEGWMVGTYLLHRCV